MMTVRWALGAILAASAVSASADELQFFARLLKRQEPGSPSYNCHDNCGQAIIQGRNSADVCHDDIFLTDYKACLQCAGPDNQDIWQYYGNTLTQDATPCGLSTTPLSGKQPDVGPAVPASSSSSSASPTSSATEAPSSESSATVTETSAASEPSSEGTSAPSSTLEVTTPSTHSETSAPVSTGSSSGSATVPATGSASVTSAVFTSFTPTSTGSASGSGNGTAPTSSGVVVINNAGKASGSSFGFYGALALGAFYVLAQ